MLLEEAPIAVDSFNHPGVELGGPQIYFCSHAHEDHMKGLSKKWRKGRLFASEITGRLLKLRWPALDITVLDLGKVHHINLDTGLEIQVYLIDANHVPGSVMFLFSGYFGSILYTGDFRLHQKHAGIAELSMLRDKALSRIYLDNTYCDPRFRQPQREDVAKAILRRVKKKWPCIVFISSYKLGKECLLLHLAKQLRCPLMVSEERRHVFNKLNLDPSELTMVQIQASDPVKANEELLYRESLRGCIWLVSRQNLRKAMCRASESGVAAHGILPTGWSEDVSKHFMPGFEDDDHCFVSDDGICSFSYSDHCSYLELVQFLEFLPCVPVTFVTPLSEAEGPYNYVGATGLKQLMQDTGIPSVRHCRKGEKMDMLKNHLAPKRPVEAAENGGG